MGKYPKYKPTGIELIKEIPEYWEKTRLKYIGFLYGGLTGKSGEDFKREEDPNNKPYINFTNICNNTYISKDNFGIVSILDGENQNIVKKGDLFFLMSSETQEDIGKTSVLKNDIGEVYLNSFCKGFRITKENFDSCFINYLLNGKDYRRLMSVEGKGFTRINLRQDKVNDFLFFYPTLSEQQQIVVFLDQKTTIIDELIRKKQRKIELLKEQRTSIINQAVTKGLNPNAKMKDSEVEWIGEIPEHWEMKKVKYLFEIRKRISGELGYDVLSVTQSGLKVKDIVSGEGQLSMDYTKYQLVFPEDFVMNHMDLLTGYVDISQYMGVTSPDYRVFTLTDNNCDKKYYLYIFQFGYKTKFFMVLDKEVLC